MDTLKLTVKEFEDLIFSITSQLDEEFILLKPVFKDKLMIKKEEKKDTEIESWDLQIAFPIDPEKEEQILKEAGKKIIRINGMKISIEKE